MGLAISQQPRKRKRNCWFVVVVKSYVCVCFARLYAKTHQYHAHTCTVHTCAPKCTQTSTHTQQVIRVFPHTLMPALLQGNMHTHRRTPTRPWSHTRTLRHTCTHTHAHKYILAHMHLQQNTCRHTHERSTHTHRQAHTQKHTHTFLGTCTRTHAHTRTRTLSLTGCSGVHHERSQRHRGRHRRLQLVVLRRQPSGGRGGQPDPADAHQRHPHHRRRLHRHWAR